VLKQDQAASQVLKEAFNLSDGEEKFIVNAKIRQGILVTQEGRIPFYNFLSDEEGVFSIQNRKKLLLEPHRNCSFLLGCARIGQIRKDRRSFSDDGHP
jgi:hypothetical protein